MKSWDSRPFEIKTHFNPAFIYLVIDSALDGYYSVAEEGIPFSLILLIPPLVLHKATRELFPKTSKTKFHSWIENRPEIKIDYAERTRNVLPYTMEALGFGYYNGLFRVCREGRLYPTEKKIGRLPFSKGSEANSCILKSRTIGKIFANTNDNKMIYTLLGVRP